MSRFLVTGGGGFVGQWLARLLLARGHEVVLAGLGPLEATPSILTTDERGSVRWISMDVRRVDDIGAALDDSRPEFIVHLAGIAFQPAGDQNPALAYDVNVLGAVRLFALLNER